MNIQFTSGQKRLLAVLVALYSSAYFCRLNLSAALDGIITALSLPISKAGFLQTVFALVYAGSALAGAVGGGLYEHLGSRALYASWIFAAIVAALLMHVSGKMSARYWNAFGKDDRK